MTASFLSENGWAAILGASIAERALAACLLDDGRRAWGTSDDPAIASAMCDGEWVGITVNLDDDGALLV